MKVVPLFRKDPGESPDTVLQEAMGELESVILVGYDKDGVLDARASLNLDFADILFALEMFKAKLLRGDYNGDQTQ